MRTLRSLAFVTAGLAVVGLAACDGRTKSAAGGQKVAVTSTDTECTVAPQQLAAGAHTFTVTNKGSKVTEFYVYGAGDKVVGEVENIAPSVTREVTVELAAGTYQAACKPGMSGDGIRTTLTVSGTAAALSDDAKLAQAVTTYQQYVQGEVKSLVTRTGEFAAAVKARDRARAKALFPVARVHFERIEPVAESFGDLDAAIDVREDGVQAGAEWTGFHRLEKDLWSDADLAPDTAVADRLVADVKKLDELAAGVKLTALELANGAKELLDEVATGKVTGEEDRYSHTDLWDFNANVEGCRAALDALRPAVDVRAPQLGRSIDERFAVVRAELAKHRSGDNWKLYQELTPVEVKSLSDAVNGLAEPVSTVATTISGT
jgi:iron uptake system component EfeO